MQQGSRHCSNCDLRCSLQQQAADLAKFANFFSVKPIIAHKNRLNCRHISTRKTSRFNRCRGLQHAGKAGEVAKCEVAAAAAK